MIKYGSRNILTGYLCAETGIFPRWHMNKAHWLSVVLDGTEEDVKIKVLMDMSCGLTKNEEVDNHFLIFVATS